jgi:hypothetical protein
LAGKPLRDWADAELRDYCERYNVGWIVCRTPAAEKRFRSWPDVEPGAAFQGGRSGRLYIVKRQPNYALAGSARWDRASTDHIILYDVVPQDGVVVLSLHYQTGLRATPSRVRLERELDSRDAIPFVRLRVDEPVARVTITWRRR